MKTKNLSIFSGIAIFILFINTCSSGNQEDKTVNENEEYSIPDAILVSTREVFKTLPTPIETAKLIYDANVKFDEKIGEI